MGRRQLWSTGWRRVPTGPYLEQKRAPVQADRSQISNLTGEPGWSSLAPQFIELFLGSHELFLPVSVGSQVVNPVPVSPMPVGAALRDGSVTVGSLRRTATDRGP